ncbi:M48 family metalloprotease [Paractinoplanes deccanensis]|uniref:M48 family metalloprotease n=1 Tax=Paractinoplanes deccanensis TaxID=113561 RepID=UPI001943FA6A|nr:M48 family metalloprotease [Actinoplanes deccanensis]
MTTTVRTGCPHCDSPLTTAPGEAPWCAGCEWNLDHFPADERMSWFWNRIAGADQRAGFRSDRLLARSADPEPVGHRGHRLLVALSAAIVLATLAAVAGGLWLIVAGGPFWPVVFGLVLLGLAWAVRPRFARLRPLLKTSYRVDPAKAPVLHALIERIAAALGTPRPDIVLFTFGWNAGVVVTGPRPRRVLVVGVQLLLALRAEELVAVLGHELGHLAYADNRRLLLTMPARLTFGRLSELVRPRVSAADLGPSLQLIGLLAWQLTGGLLSWLLFAAHLAVNSVAARDDRTVELRADEMAARAAGTGAALRAVDALATLPVLTEYVQHHVPKGEAAATWRRMLRSVRERESARASARRQLSIRANASLFASHPAPGRRYQWLDGRPRVEAAVVVAEAEAEALEREIAPYAEALHRTMLKEIVHD